jgi:hypothetical protein
VRQSRSLASSSNIRGLGRLQFYAARILGIAVSRQYVWLLG